ncbi:MAG: hypothetical protein P1S60_14080 [Anaerolineae bacterium]|nr:hypothetical protein [Anaerolineae bacterium]
MNNTSDTGTAPILLKNEKLTVEIAQPGEHYNGTRFDWSGFITQVTLDDQHTFCMPESLKPGKGTGGSGLCNEFGIEKPVGYDEVPVGGLFPKLGIGVLRRSDESRYRFARPYEIVERFPIIIDADEQQVVFYVEPVECNGYAARLRKTISISGAELTIDYVLENAGSRDLVTHEYCHNFLRIDGHQIGPDYVLRMPYPISLERMGGHFGAMLPRWMRSLLPQSWLAKLGHMVFRRMLAVLSIRDNEIRWTSTPEKAFYCRLQGFHQTGQAQWTLRHEPSGVQIQEYDDFAPARVAVWGVQHVVSAEVFVDIDLKPGQSKNWQRRYVMSA